MVLMTFSDFYGLIHSFIHSCNNQISLLNKDLKLNCLNYEKYNVPIVVVFDTGTKVLFFKKCN